MRYTTGSVMAIGSRCAGESTLAAVSSKHAAEVKVKRGDCTPLHAAAAALAVEGAVVSHGSAVGVFGLATADIPPKISLTHSRLASGCTRLSGVTIHRAAMPADHRVLWLGVPVTTPARTVADLARALPFREAVTVADAVLHARLTSHAELLNVISHCSRWPGAAQARKVTAFADPKAESALESIGRVVFAEQGLPAPESQAEIVIRSGQVFRVDFLWRGFRTIAEADGMLKYAAPSALRDEKLRQEALSDLGYEVVRFTWKQLHADPAGVAARVRGAFARAARHASSGRGA